MKKIVIVVLFLVITRSAGAQSVSAETLAVKIADKMRDTLGLTQDTRDSLYQVNKLLQTQKFDIRQRYSNPDSVQIHTQRVESTRDSLYYPLLSRQQYELYRQKKAVLISAF
jgi:hypothetical protein